MSPGHPGLHSELQANQDYIVTPYLNNEMVVGMGMVGVVGVVVMMSHLAAC